MMGAERRTLVMTEEEKKLTAYHEAGHAHGGTASVKASDPIQQGNDYTRAGVRWAWSCSLPEKRSGCP